MKAYSMSRLNEKSAYILDQLRQDQKCGIVNFDENFFKSIKIAPDEKYTHTCVHTLEYQFGDDLYISMLYLLVNKIRSSKLDLNKDNVEQRNTHLKLLTH